MKLHEGLLKPLMGRGDYNNGMMPHLCRGEGDVPPAVLLQPAADTVPGKLRPQLLQLVQVLSHAHRGEPSDHAYVRASKRGQHEGSFSHKRPLLGLSSDWKRLQPLSHLGHY